MSEPIWTAVLAVKRLDAAKSRLRGALDGVAHEQLALALAQDTVTATVACTDVAHVLVVTDDDRVAGAFEPLPVRLVPEGGEGGLNRALSLGAELADGQPVAALAADLPALRPVELAAALRAAAAEPPGRRFVTDTPGTGTVLLTASAGVPLDPRFGAESAETHASSGAAPLRGTWPSLRRDVDTAADLAAAAVLGLGRQTAALVGRLYATALDG
ncbi:2-phospho-L-lactate guanylyltransferase [Plantactinospora sp. KBS50]|uniref:2-phospho-L-lactate guanylyltransferase n=1 Tax=Plantactinospora sp. KBS50 TaxID=2024580 RepID=UPI001E2952BE|nr:2-phospho-L-lactate guanylyltransferase [Plantactinospora sp. KBS50]